MKKEIQKQMKGNRGITLIALVVTIVVLLILAGITISTLFGDNGIITAAKKAAEDTKQGENDVNKGLSDLEKNINEQVYGIVEPKNIEHWEWIEDQATKTITITKYTGTSDTEVVIPNYINGKKVVKLGAGKYGSSDSLGGLWKDDICSNIMGAYGYKQETIKKVIISEGIEVISDFCFAESVNLKQVEMPNSLKEIGIQAFVDCKNLDNIVIPNSVEIVKDTPFWLIPNITIYVPFTSGNIPSGWNSSWNRTEGTVTVNYMYGKPIDQKYFTYTLDESAKTAKITGIKEEYGVKGYYHGVESEWDIITAIKTESGEYITDIIIPSKLTKDGKEYTVTEIGDNAFGSQNRASWIGTYTIERDFTSFTIPPTVTKIGYYAFGGCNELTNITIPSSVTTMGSNVFYNIPSITVNVPFTSGNKPSGWDNEWNYTSSGTITVNYKQ